MGCVMSRVMFRNVILGMLIVWVAVSSGSTIGDSPGAMAAVSGQAAGTSAFEEGLQLARQGAFEQAVGPLQEAAEQYSRAGAPTLQADALVVLAQAYAALGYYMKAAQNLEVALTLVQSADDHGRQAAVLGALGQVYLQVGQFDAASQYLRDGEDAAKKAGDTARTATILNDRGRLQAMQSDYSGALQSFMDSHLVAESAGLTAPAATAAINAGQAAMRLDRPQDARVWFDRALVKFRKLPPSHDQAYGLITVGLAYEELGSSSPEENMPLTLKAASVLEEAGEVASQLGDQRAMSYAFGHRGHLYEREGQYEEALLLTRRALAAAQQVNAPESLYRWEWQTGRILNTLGQQSEAIEVYGRAAQTVQSIRPELTSASPGAAAAFRESAGRLFFELADLLLQHAAAAPDKAGARPFLVRARDAIERFKSAELRDYFRDDCVDALQSRRKPLDEVVSHGTAVLYPIMLPDRTELLLSSPSGMERFAVPVPEARITGEVRRFRKLLEKRTTREYLVPAQQLYDWLIRPLESRLDADRVTTLVVVPDGAVRTIPLATLHDGERFLIEKYAVATTPGLDLTDPQPLPREGIRVLAVGLTEGVQGFPPLPNVMTEVQTLEDLYNAQPLLNQGFLIANFEKRLREQKFTIVHIASHGKFESRVADSFVLTFDDKMTMDLLNRYVGYFRFRDEPLELLTLSACETAAGDDRAALGLAGVAIKAGARSALATLWFINDQASSALVAEFYKQLQNPSLSKAEALQRAQMTLLADPAYAHPSYWAPFLLLNNWL